MLLQTINLPLTRFPAFSTGYKMILACALTVHCVYFNRVPK